MEVVEWVLGRRDPGRTRHDDQPLRRPGGRPDGQGRRADPRAEAAHAGQGRSEQEPDIGQVGEIEAINPAVVKALQDDAFIPVISPIGFGAERPDLQHQRRRRRRQDRRDPEGREADDADQHAGRAGQERQPADRVVRARRSTSCSPTARFRAACCRRSPRRWRPPRANSQFPSLFDKPGYNPPPSLRGAAKIIGIIGG